ncbi:MAG: class I SAM-dependent methyltransferase [Solirubrobacteraceae bacterium MAG38_C4-C5]|nr:class I SAM-dependent methyltransferase [Candidatus Siliceabacter maunaloa]
MSTTTGGPPTTALWHDLECGTYAADLPLWRELAADTTRPTGPILDVGAGTGRVALALARAGHEVVALDRDQRLLAVLRERAARDGLSVETVTGDARTFALDRGFALVLAPMQTVQLLGGPAGVEGFVRCTAAHLRPGGLLAAALAEAVPFTERVPEPSRGCDGGPHGCSVELELPPPDMLETGGWLYTSQPVAVRPDPGGGAWLERRREAVAPDGARMVELDRILLDAVSPAALRAAGRRAGLRPLPARAVASTEDHVGSDVVLLEMPR